VQVHSSVVVGCEQIDQHDNCGTPDLAPLLEDMERAAIEQALRRSEGHRQKAAEELGIGLRTLYDKLKRYDLG